MPLDGNTFKHFITETHRSKDLLSIIHTHSPRTHTHEHTHHHQEIHLHEHVKRWKLGCLTLKRSTIKFKLTAPTTTISFTYMQMFKMCTHLKQIPSQQVMIKMKEHL